MATKSKSSKLLTTTLVLTLITVLLGTSLWCAVFSSALLFPEEYTGQTDYLKSKYAENEISQIAYAAICFTNDLLHEDRMVNAGTPTYDPESMSIGISDSGKSGYMNAYLAKLKASDAYRYLFSSGYYYSIKINADGLVNQHYYIYSDDYDVDEFGAQSDVRIVIYSGRVRTDIGRIPESSSFVASINDYLEYSAPEVGAMTLSIQYNDDYLARSNEELAMLDVSYRQAQQAKPFIFALAAAFAVVFLLTIVIGCIKPKEKNLLSRIPGEILALVLLLSFAALFSLTDDAVWEIRRPSSWLGTLINVFGVNLHFLSAERAAPAAPLIALLTLSLIGLLRQMFGKMLWKNSIISHIINLIKPTKLYQTLYAKNLFSRQRWLIITMIAALAVCILLFIIAPAFFSDFIPVMLAVFLFPVLIFIYALRNSKDLADCDKLLGEIESLSDIDTADIEPLDEESLLHDTSVRLCNLQDSLQQSVAQQVRAEKMKLELLTNVSHDLKTPLTSIISYIELLEDEEMSETARGYVEIIASKSARLNRMIIDLIDLAKLSGENIAFESETLDFGKLVTQSLVDMQDRIDASGLTVRLNLPGEPVYISADGQHMCRVLQNMLDNALKYSQMGTRIYITLSSDGENASLRTINTASYEMNFTAEDICERFTRGDASRSTEGSGLGLSIIRSFTEACGGKCSVEIDGDQFRVTLIFPLVQGYETTADCTQIALADEQAIATMYEVDEPYFEEELNEI